MALVISKDRLWPKLHYSPNQAQRAIHRSTARLRVVAAGRRTGKSTAGGRELVPEAYRAYFHRQMLEDQGLRNEFWIVGPQYTDSEKEFRVFYNSCKKLQMPFDRPGTYYDKRGGDMTVSLWGGRLIVSAQSAKYPDHLVGEGLRGVIMAEAAKMKERIWTQYIRPTLVDYRGWALFNSTPEGKNWYYTLWQRGQHSGDPTIESFRFPSYLNEMIFPLGEDDPEIAELIKDLSEEMIAQEIYAKFQEFVGQVFKAWDEEWHVRPLTYQPTWPLYLATDYGWTNPNVCLFIQVDPFDRVYIIDEYYQSHRSPEEFAQDLLDGTQSTRHPALARAATLLYPDPADPGASHTLAEKLKVRVMSNTGGELKDRLELIRKWLKDENPHLPHDHPDRRPLTLVDPRCKKTIYEFGEYRYPRSKEEAAQNETENPMKKDDHTPEAFGRFVKGHFGLQAVRGRPRVHRARFRR